MGTMIVRYQTRPEATEENQRLVERVFAQLAEDKPGGLRYATFLLADGVTFFHIAVIDGETNPLPGTEAFQEFQSAVGERSVEPPEPAAATVIGDYRFGLE